MRIIAFVRDRPTVERILEQIGEPTQPPAVLPASTASGSTDKVMAVPSRTSCRDELMREVDLGVVGAAFPQPVGERARFAALSGDRPEMGAAAGWKAGGRAPPCA